MKIHYITPYSIEKNFGKAINDQVALIPDSDWVCVMDGDTMFLTPEWGRQVSAVIERHGKRYSLFGCLTNRLGRPIQRYKGEFSDNLDMMYHFNIAKELEQSHYAQVDDITSQRRIAGMFMLFPKTLWNKIKFKENTPNFDDIFSTDVIKAKKKIALIKGLYIFHWYRADKANPKDRTHLMNSADTITG